MILTKSVSYAELGWNHGAVVPTDDGAFLICLPLEVLPVGETSRSDRGGAVTGEEKGDRFAVDEVEAFPLHPFH